MIEYIGIVFSEVYKILFLLIPLLISVAMIVWLDRRVWAFVQKRRGPNVVGPFGLFQSFADVLKYVFKEIIIPASSNKTIFILAPVVTMTLALIAWAVIPFSETQVLANINVGILYLFAVSSLSVEIGAVEFYEIDGRPHFVEINTNWASATAYDDVEGYGDARLNAYLKENREKYKDIAWPVYQHNDLTMYLKFYKAFEQWT